MGDKVEQKNSNILRPTAGFFWLCSLFHGGNSSQTLQTGEESVLGLLKGSFDHSVPRIFLF